MEERMRKWDLSDQIIVKVCEIEGTTIKDDKMYNKDGVLMPNYDFECVAFADKPVRVNDEENVIAVYLYGDGCLELNIHDGNDENYGESYNWSEFSIEVLEKVLETLNKIKE